MTRQHRWHEIDICRGIGILLVLYGHAIEMALDKYVAATGEPFRQWQLIYSFHMPLFFMLSGAVHRHKGVAHALRSAAFLIALALATHVIGWLVRSASILIEMDHMVNWNALWRPFYTLCWFSTTVTWFLAALGLVQVVHALMCAAAPAWRWAMFAALVGATIWHHMTHRHVLQLAALLPALAFFHLGWMFATSRSARQHLESLPGWQLLAMAAVLAVMLVALAPLNQGCLFNPMARCDNMRGGFVVFVGSGVLGFIPLFMLSALLGSALVHILAVLLRRLPAVRALPDALAWVGRQSLLLLLLNGFVLMFVQPRLMQHFRIGPETWSAMAWAGGLSAAQVLVLPVWRRLAQPLISLADAIADASLAAMKRVAFIAGVPAAR